MKNIGIKVFSGSIGLSSIVGAGYALNHFLSDNTISKSLKDKGYKLLDFDIYKKDNLENWENIVRSYSSSQKKINNLTIATIQTSVKPTEENINDLKKECQKITKLNKQDTKNLKLAEQFCVTPITIKDFLAKNKTILDSIDGTSNAWDEKVANYLIATSERHIENINLKISSLTNAKAKREELEKGCDLIGAKKTHENDYHKSLSLFEEWCANPK